MTEPPPGFHVEWVDELALDEELLRWRLATDEERETKRCRYGAGPKTPACGRPPVAAIWRRTSWWLYCEEHLYGRRLTDDGRLLGRRIVKDAE